MVISEDVSGGQSTPTRVWTHGIESRRDVCNVSTMINFSFQQWQKETTHLLDSSPHYNSDPTTSASSFSRSIPSGATSHCLYHYQVSGVVGVSLKLFGTIDVDMFLTIGSSVTTEEEAGMREAARQLHNLVNEVPKDISCFLEFHGGGSARVMLLKQCTKEYSSLLGV